MTPPETTFRPDRVERSLLSVPATSERFFAKAAASAADTVMLDLEDSVAPGQKVEARRQVIPVVNGRDWGRRTLAVRVNALDTPWGVRDLLEVAEACPRLDLVMVPKVERAEDLFAVETILRAAEQAAGRSRPIG
ncbi:MAG: aldolase/citrate lyase family protein, partial [Deltaproteobacteria bacterium]|nr:aldolase/citrate lyase family protein [Deltaproteobacteria bacterium]